MQQLEFNNLFDTILKMGEYRPDLPENTWYAMNHSISMVARQNDKRQSISIKDMLNQDVHGEIVMDSEGRIAIEDLTHDQYELCVKLFTAPQE